MTDAAPAHAALVLAAGGSRRLGQPKQLLPCGDETLVRRAARMALATAPLRTLVVLGADADAVFASLSGLAVTRVDCADWQTGLAASLRAGLAAVPAAAAGLLIVLCDQPALDAAHLERLCQAWREQPGRAAASRYAGRLGVPALVPRAWFADLLGLSGDAGARDLLAQRRAEVAAVDNEALAADIDVPADLVVANLKPASGDEPAQ